MAWSVYIVRTHSGTLYTGVSTDVARRYREHAAGGRRAARYLRAHPPSELAFAQAIGPKWLALRVEHRLKRLPRARKETLIRRGSLHYDAARDAIVPGDAAPAGATEETGSGRLLSW